MTKNHATKLALAALGALTLLSCAHNPLGRRQFIIVSDNDMNTMGAQAFTELKQQQPATPNGAVNAYVDCVANAITSALDKPQQWEIVVFDEPKTVNAFALPGGKIGVYTGILPVASTPGQLAAVLGHEVSHVLARHGAERVSQQEALSVGVNTVGALMGNPTTRTLVVGALGAGSQVGITLPFSRKQESEADNLGQQLMAKAGFDPREAVTLWETMAKLGAGGPSILSDHPSDANRVAALQKGLAKTVPMFEQARAAGRNPNCVPAQ